jgi:hypothetical protein
MKTMKNPSLPMPMSITSPVPVTRVETITPEIASDLLTRNSRNRNLMVSYVDALAAMITAGEWLHTHQGIAIAMDGTLLDGQHRLAAIVKANCAVSVLVTRGLPMSTIDAIDTGRARRAWDVIAIADQVAMTGRERSAVIACATLAQHGTLAVAHPRISAQWLRAARNEHLSDVQPIVYGAITKFVPASLIGSMAMIHRTMPAEVQRFMEEYRSGANLSEGSPILALRGYMLRQNNSLSPEGRDQISLRSFSAFDAWVHGRERVLVKANESARAHYLRPWRSL